MQTLLKTHFGYEEFRPGQERIIEHVLSGRDALILMPTGGGKSLCFQLPALKLPGVTLVISPLISLMKDQVDALKANGIAAEFINSSLPPGEIQRVQRQVRDGQVKLLYLAPERLAIGAFRQYLSALDISLIAIDEAHCISEWGHDFRPDYRNLAALRGQFPAVTVIALTATATERVRKDIVVQLQLNNARLFIASFNRPNLTYVVKPKRSAYSDLVSELEKYRGESVIIYCLSRSDTEALAEDLRADGFSALAYHAGLEPRARKAAQEKFITDEAHIIVATIAFGMGIDKPDVRAVVHYHLPKSIEGYYQETGRAGRDGLPSRCLLYYSFGDTIKHEYFIREMDNPSEQANARGKLRQVVEYGELATCRRQFLLKYFGEEYDPDKTAGCGACDICLAPREEFDATEITQKILSAVIRTGSRFGVNYVIDVLKGSESQKVAERGHNRLSVYAVARESGKDELKQIIGQLLARGLLFKTEGVYATLALTPAGRRFLDLRESITLVKPRLAVEVSAGREERALEYDQELFARLRGLRKRLADERGVPPFVVFGDASLQAMAYYFPQSRESFIKISGVGREKLKQFGEIFTDAIRAYAREHNLKEREIPARRASLERRVKRDGSTYEETKRYLEAGLPLAEISEKRELAMSTIVTHLEKLIAAGVELDIDYVKPAPDRFEAIKEAFRQSGQLNLSPVREILGEDYSYEEIRLARLFL